MLRNAFQRAAAFVQDRQVSPPTGRYLVWEIGLLWLLTLLAIKAFVFLVQGLGAPEILLVAVPVLFMYAPVVLCELRGVDSWSYPLALPAYTDWRPWWQAVRLNLVVVGGVFVPFLVGYHYWQTLVMGYDYVGTWPSSMLMLIGYHLLFVAIPEEFFYRGYIQTRLDELWPQRWNILGTYVGPSLLVTSVIFAFGHSIVQVQWWHFAIIIPSIAFGWLRARTGGVVAGALFHAWCNITVTTLDTLYGIVPP